MKYTKILLALIILIGLSFSGCDDVIQETPQTKNTDTYDRVIETKIIRVGYINYPPGFIIDPNTQEFSGIFYDIAKELEKSLDIKFDYIKQSAWDDIILDLKDGKIDLLGSPVWPTSDRGKFVEFSAPLYYDVLLPYVRIDDNRFDGNISILNNYKYKIATIIGEISQDVANDNFPDASIIENVKLTHLSQLLTDVSVGKADITFSPPNIANKFIKNNPDKVKQVTNVEPLRIYPNVMVLRKGDFKLKSMLDIAILELQNSGRINEIISKYEEHPGDFYRVQYPYRVE